MDHDHFILEGRHLASPPHSLSEYTDLRVCSELGIHARESEP
jgi:hypothetical protein